MKHEIHVNRATDCHDGCEFGSPDCRPGSGGFHGVTSSQITFAAFDERGAVTLQLWANWYLRATRERWRRDPPGAMTLMLADGLGTVAFHHPVAIDTSLGQSDECPYLPDGCWSDGSYTMTEAMFDVLVTGGSDALWEHLDAKHAERFGS
jgi:hypothetical protein